MTRHFVVEIIDEEDALIGYGVCVETIRQIEERVTESGFRMLPTIYGTRSSAHGAIESKP